MQRPIIASKAIHMGSGTHSPSSLPPGSPGTACLANMQVYTQMNKTLGKVFFPSKDPALQALSFWGV